MKSKKFTKKLTLNKSTVSVLDKAEEQKAKGGYYYTNFVDLCYTWHPVCWTRPTPCIEI